MVFPPERRTPWGARLQGVRRRRRRQRSRRWSSGGGCAVAPGVGVLDQLLEMRLRFVLLHLERVHELRGEDLLGAGVHLLLAGGETLLALTDGEVAYDLGQLEHVAGLDLLAVVLEAPVPV